VSNSRANRGHVPPENRKRTGRAAARRASRDPRLYLLAMTALGGIYLAFVLIHCGHQALATRERRANDAELDALTSEGTQ